MQQHLSLLVALGLSVAATAQNTRAALNDHIQYINTSSEQVERMVESVGDLYPQVRLAAEGKNRNRVNYRCPYNEEPYYRTQAQKGTLSQPVRTASEGFQAAFDAVAAQCQAVDTYFKLESYKNDQYAGALALLRDMPALVAAFEQNKQTYEGKIAQIAPKKASTGPYATADGQMQRILSLHRGMMQDLRYQFTESVPTGWPQQAVLAHITRMADALADIAQNKPKLGYPASSFYQSCLDCAQAFLESQRSYVDAYNVKAQETDEHSNDYYRESLNQYSNCMVSFYNQFTEAAVSAGYGAVKMTRWVPRFVLEAAPVWPDKTVKTYQAREVPPVTLVPQAKPIGAGTAAALNTCVAFINACAQKNNYLLMALQNNGIHYRPFPEKNALYFSYDTHTLPHSLLAEVERQLRQVPEAYRQPLLAQARVLMDISVEMEGLRQSLVDFSRDQRWAQEGFGPVERIRDRYITLFALFDQKKEQYYADIAQIYASYPAPPAANAASWQRSYQALTAVVQADKTLCATAAQQYAQQSEKTIPLPYEAVENAAVKAIQDEFANMKGIEKLGRYNGLCPYSPYEDIGTNSRRLVEYAQTPDRKKPTDFTYLYNTVVEDYNDFVRLSGQPFLKNTRLMDAFLPTPPPSAVRRPVMPPVSPRPKVEEPVAQTKPQPVGNLRDTIYIRDTIYLEKPPAVGAKFYSLEGFPANNLVFLLDVSGSMKTEDRLTLLQSSIGRLVQLLRDEDDISVVSFSGKAKVLLPPTSGKKKAQISETVQGLKPEGTTNIEEGLKMAFQTARKNFKRDGNNRIILATDGDFTLSKAMLEQVQQHAEIGISLSVFKFGSKPGQSLKAISDSGRGNLISITPENAEIFMIKEAQQ